MAHVQSRSLLSSVHTTHTLAFNSNTVAANAILVHVRSSVTGTVVNSISDTQGNTYTAVTGTPLSNGVRRAWAWYAENTAGGANTISIVTAANSTLRFTISEYDSVPASGVVDDSAVAAFTTTTTPTTANVTTTIASDVIVSFVQTDGASTTIAPNSGETERQQVDDLVQLQDEAAAGAGTYNASWLLGTTQPGTYIIVALKSGSTTPNITDVDTDNSITSTQAGVVITGTGFGADGANAKIELISGSITSQCTKTAWANTSITFTTVQGNVPYGTVTVKITTQAGLTDTQSVTLTAPSGVAFVDVVTLKTLTWNTLGTPSRLTPKGSSSDATADMTAATQIEYQRSAGSGTVTVDDDGRLEWDDTATQLSWRWHNGTVWSSAITWDIRGLFPTFPGPNVPNLTYLQNSPITALAHSQRYIDIDATATGGSYSLIGGPVAGITFNSASGSESGTPTTITTYPALNLRFTDPEGSYVDSNTFTRTVEAAPNPPFFTGLIPDSSMELTETFNLDVTNFFGFENSYAMSGSLPPGLALGTLTGIIAGTATTAGNFTGLRVIASGTTPPPSTSNSFAIEVQALDVLETPDLYGMSSADAITVIGGLSLVSASSIRSSARAADTVIDQSPAAGTPITIGSTVTIFLASGDVIRYDLLARGRKFARY